MADEVNGARRLTDDEPDPALLWRWVGRATRPWAGWVFLGVGALLILVGYLGVSREAIVAKQIPYLVSGGIGGVLLAIVGAYFLGTEELRKDSGRLDRLERMVEELHGVLLERTADANEAAGADAVPSGNGAGVTRSTSERVMAVAGGQTFHLASCQVVAGKDAEELSADEARGRHLRPCRVCQPADVASA
jgi:hypothetical protein